MISRGIIGNVEELPIEQAKTKVLLLCLVKNMVIL